MSIERELSRKQVINQTSKGDLEGLEKARGLPVGATREWKGRTFKKVAPGKWRPVRGKPAEVWSKEAIEARGAAEQGAREKFREKKATSQQASQEISKDESLQEDLGRASFRAAEAMYGAKAPEGPDYNRINKRVQNTYVKERVQGRSKAEAKKAALEVADREAGE